VRAQFHIRTIGVILNHTERTETKKGRVMDVERSERMPAMGNSVETETRAASTLDSRMPIGEVRRQHDLIVEAGDVRTLLDRLPHAVLLINRQRQIVYANPAAARLLPSKSVEGVIGLRTGEALNCRHSDETPGGCGTTEFCTQCGAQKALRAGQRGEHASDECRIISKTLGNDLDLRVWAAPLPAGGETFTLFTIMDIGDEKRREMLERVFFHDVLNTAGGIQGMASLFADSTPEEREEISGIVARLSSALVEELKTQQSLPLMERGELLVQREPVSSLEMLESVVEAYRMHQVRGDRRLCISADSDDVTFDTDPTLLRRVIGNMTKNALEACPSGGTVTLSCGSDVQRVLFRVHNPTAIPRHVQLQLFQRSFSTKGPGRGLGTYSMKLLSERYLDGDVSFISSEEHGTTFVAAYRRLAPGGPDQPGRSSPGRR
jgi:nitrogen-specific signal transduction histidine kinase